MVQALQVTRNSVFDKMKGYVLLTYAIESAGSPATQHIILSNYGTRQLLKFKHNLVAFPC